MAENHVIVSTKGGVGKTTIALNVMPCLMEVPLEKINIFEIDDNNLTNVEQSKMNFYHVTLKKLPETLIDIELTDGINVIDSGGGNDSKEVVKALKQDEIEVTRFYVPATHDFEVLTNIESTIKLIREYYPEAEIYLVLNRVYNTEDEEEIKKQFMFLYGSDEYVINRADYIFREISQVMVVPEESNVFALVKNIYNTTTRDLLEKGRDILENIQEYNRKIKEKALKIKEEQGPEEAKAYLDDKKRKLRLLKKLDEICKKLKELNPVLAGL
jgi:MinD-like ATPase involved in chromosome partitioning or flagellar assembly